LNNLLLKNKGLNIDAAGKTGQLSGSKGTNPSGASFPLRGVPGTQIMTCIKTFSTSFPHIVARLRLAYENGGFTVHNGDLMQIVSFDEIDSGRGVIVDLVPAQFGAHADVWQHAA
jgi:hypothetical protein